MPVDKPVLSVAHAFAIAISAYNIKALADLMTEDHAFIDSLGTKIEGKQNMMKGSEGYFRMVPRRQHYG